VWVNINAPGWGSVSKSPAETPLLLLKRERYIFNNCGMILALFIHWLGPPFLPWCSEAMLAIWSERLAKGPYQKNTPLAVGLEPVIYRLQIQALIN